MKTSNHHAIVTFVIVLCFHAVQHSDAQWVQTNGPFGGFAEAMCVSGTDLFVGTSAGVYFSSDKGAHWSPRNNGLTNPRVRALAISGNLLYAAAWRTAAVDEVFRSTDLGLSWTKTNTGMTSTDIRALCISGAYVFAGTSSGVFRAGTAGGNWAPVNSGLGSGYVYTLVVSGPYVLAGMDAGVYRTSNSGGVWKRSSGGLSSTPRIRALAASGSAVYAGGDGGVFRSSNNGGKWVSKNAGFVNSANTGIAIVYSLACAGTTVVAGTYDGGVLWSSNSGSNWTPTALKGTTNSMTLAGSFAFAGTGNGVYRSTNNGTSWTQENAGIAGAYVYALTVNGTKLLAGATHTGYGGVHTTTDGGMNWNPTSGNVSRVDAFHATGTDIFAGTWNGLWRSSDNGATWNESSTLNYIKAFAGTSSALFMGVNACCSTSYNGVYRSTDGGTTWIMVNTGLTYQKVEALAVGEAALFAGTVDGGVFLSTDEGGNWTAVNNGLSDLSVTALAFSGTVLFAGTGGGQVFISTNYGANWSWAGNGLGGAAVNAFAVNGAGVFAATADGIYSTTNNGNTWSDVSAGMLGSRDVQALQILGADMYAAIVGSGVWKRPLSQMPKQQAAAQPSMFRLEQNYPNPFNSTTTITYSLLERDHVVLRVFDVQGRIVAQLVNDAKSAGIHAVQFDAGNLPGGVYICRLESATRMSSAVMTVTK